MERVALAPVQADGKRRDFNDLRRPSQAPAQWGRACRRHAAYDQPPMTGSGLGHAVDLCSVSKTQSSAFSKSPVQDMPGRPKTNQSLTRLFRYRGPLCLPWQSVFNSREVRTKRPDPPPLDFSQRRHLPHANCEASLGSGCRSLAERLQGGAAAVNVGPRLWTMSTVQSLAPEGAVNRCPSVVRKPTRLSLENPAGGHPQRARQATRRPCGTSWRTCAQPVRRPRSESNASSAPAGEVHLCPTVGRCARRGMASPTVRTPSVQSRRSVSTSVRVSNADNTHEGAMQHDSTQEKQRP